VSIGSTGEERDMRIFRREVRTLRSELDALELSVRRAGDIRRALIQMYVPDGARGMQIIANFHGGDLTVVISYEIIEGERLVTRTEVHISGTSARDVRRIQALLKAFNEKKNAP